MPKPQSCMATEKQSSTGLIIETDFKSELSFTFSNIEALLFENYDAYRIQQSGLRFNLLER